MRYFIALLIIITPFFSFGNEYLNPSDTLANTDTLDVQHTVKFVIKIKDEEFLLDSIPHVLDPDWIKDITVIRRGREKFYCKSANEIVLLEPYKKYYKTIKGILKESNVQPIKSE